jgi:hypothetical protein
MVYGLAPETLIPVPRVFQVTAAGLVVGTLGVQVKLVPPDVIVDGYADTDNSAPRSAVPVTLVVCVVLLGN